MKRIKSYARNAISEKVDAARTLRDRATDPQVPLPARIGGIAVDGAVYIARARWKHMKSAWGIAGIAAIQGLHYGLGLLPLLTSQIEDPGQVLGEFQAAQAEYLVGAAEVSNLDEQQTLSVFALERMRNDVSMERYAVLHARGRRDAEAGKIDPPGIAAAADALRAFEVNMAGYHAEAARNLAAAGLEEEDALAGAHAATAYALFGTEHHIRGNADGMSLLVTVFAGRDAWSPITEDPLKAAVTEAFIGAMEPSWVETTAITELTGVTREDIEAEVGQKDLQRIAQDSTGWRLSTSYVQLWVNTSPAADLDASQEP